MSLMTTGTTPKALWPGVNAWWGRFYNEHGEEWGDLVDKETSDMNYEEDVMVNGFGLPVVKTQGGSISYDAENQGYVKRYTHVTYALGYMLTREEMEDNKYEKVGKRRTKALAFSMRQGKEIVVANVYNRAFSSSYTGGESKELLATDHPGTAGTWQNEPTSSTDISETAIEDMLVLIMNAKNDKGLNIALMAQSLIVPPQLWFEANRILKSTLQNDSANNATNVLKATNAIPGGIKVNHYLTDTDAWFVRTNCPEGLKLFQRRAIEFKQDSPDFDTENLKYKSSERFSVGWTDPRCLYGSPGA